MKPTLSLETLQQARSRIAPGLRRTRCTFSKRLSELAGFSIWLKHDHEQATGSFKERGARNALLSLTAEQRRRGVVAASAGNHALGLAYHARDLSVGVTVVMPQQAPKVKIQRCRDLGATVLLQGANFDQSADFAKELCRETRGTLIHPFDDLNVIAGQGTLGLEIAEEVENLEAVIVPVGGGGLLAGVGTAIKTLYPSAEVIAVEPAHAPSYSLAFAEHRPVAVPVSSTLADGLAVSQVGNYTFALSQPLVDRVVTVTEDELATALLLLSEVEGVTVEGAGAAALAACLSGKLTSLFGKTVVLPLCGRNIDPLVHRRALWRARSARDYDREEQNLASAG